MLGNILDFLCRNYIINGLVDYLYNVYSDKKTTKELWESLDRKYKTEDDRSKKFVVSRFLDFKMVDSILWQIKSKNFLSRLIYGMVDCDMLIIMHYVD